MKKEILTGFYLYFDRSELKDSGSPVSKFPKDHGMISFKPISTPRRSNSINTKHNSSIYHFGDLLALVLSSTDCGVEENDAHCPIL